MSPPSRTICKTRKVKLLVYNSQATDPTAERMRDDRAGRPDVPVVGVTETEPAGMTYQAWMAGAARRARPGALPKRQP